MHSDSNTSLTVRPRHVAGALGSLLQEFEGAFGQFKDKIPAMLRPFIEEALSLGVFRDTDGAMAHRLWLYLEREVLRESDGGPRA